MSRWRAGVAVIEAHPDWTGGAASRVADLEQPRRSPGGATIIAFQLGAGRLTGRRPRRDAVGVRERQSEASA